jgi:hypothetical protein
MQLHAAGLQLQVLLHDEMVMLVHQCKQQLEQQLEQQLQSYFAALTARLEAADRQAA